jgi:integrase
MATAKLMLRRGKAKDNVKAIVLCISHKGKNTEISLDKSVDVDYWDKDAQNKVKRGCPQYSNIRSINNFLNNELSKAWECIEYLKKSRKIQSMTVSDISNYIKSNDNSGTYTVSTDVQSDGENVNFIEYFGHYISCLNNSKTRHVYGDTLKAVKRYLGEGNELYFNEVNTGWLTRFKRWRQTEVAASTTSLSLMVLKAVFNHAIDVDEVIPQNLYPFRKFKVPKIQPRNLRLPIETIRAIRDSKPENEKQELAKDFFMLSFYLIGMNNSDIYDIKTILSGRVEYYRNKTSKPYSIKIEPEAMEIFNRRKGAKKLLIYQERYNGSETLQQAVNKALKEIGKGVGVPDLKMYHARHSWAGIAAKKPIGAGKPLIAQALGHGTQTVTDTYFDYDNELVDDLNRKVIDLLNQPVKKENEETV